jgi:putative component of membrane protein insertase Oxa1/YidC/SpoIIIJ protein YidD
LGRLLVLAIAIYRLVIPERWRRRCLFRVSCSRHVEQAARQRGLVAGLAALLSRMRRCKPGYRLSTKGGDLHLILADGSQAVSSQNLWTPEG